MIAYFFPPEGNAGSYRPLRFVRHLATLGWRTSVISAEPYRYERYDPDLVREVPKDTEIIRVRGRDPWLALQARRIQRTQEILSAASMESVEKLRTAQHRPFRSQIREIVRTAEALHYRPDMAKPWIRPATKAAINLCKREQADVIWATAGPVSAWVVARQVWQQTGIPYVLDLRDPHGLNYYESDNRRPEWASRKVKRDMCQLFKGARAIAFLFDTVAEYYFRAFPGAIDPAKVHIIPNGYDGTIEDTASPTGNKFTVLYTGTIATYRYDTFLHALSLLKKSDPAKAQSFHFKFVGEDMEDLAKKAATLGLSDIVETSGPTSYAEITRLQRKTHAFLVLGRPSTIKGHELVAGAKLFNYLKIRRPILGVVPGDETRKILNGLGMSTVADVDSPTDIVNLLKRVERIWSAGAIKSLVPDRSKCESYSAEYQTKALIRALTGVPAATPFIVGRTEIPLSLQETCHT